MFSQTSVRPLDQQVVRALTDATTLSTQTGASARDLMELSKAAYYADLILYPLLVVGLGAREMTFVHAFPYVWLCSMALGLLTWTISSFRFAFRQIGRSTS